MLKQNTTLAAQYPYRLRGGGGAAQQRSMWARADRVNQYASDGITDSRASVPSGHLAPSAWLLPQVAGGMSSRNEAVMAITPSGTAAQGINLISNSVLTLTTSGDAAAVAAAIGQAILILNASGNAVAPLNAEGVAAMILSASANTSGIATITGSSACAISPGLITAAIGHMVAVPIDQQLTPESIASAVWAAIASLNNAAGSMGEKLNDAGSASNPWTEVIENGMTAAEIIKLLLAVAAGDAVGLNDGAVVFKSQDGTLNRIEATQASGNRTIDVINVT